jgi:hypothetical protein
MSLTGDGFNAAMQQRLIDPLLILVKRWAKKRVRRHPPRPKLLKRGVVGGGTRLETQSLNSMVDCATQVAGANRSKLLGQSFNICAALVENIERNLMKPRRAVGKFLRESILNNPGTPTGQPRSPDAGTSRS